MPEQIYTFSDEEVARMLRSGEMKLLTTPTESVRDKTDHEKALEKAKKLFWESFENVQTLKIGGKSIDQLYVELQEAMINNYLKHHNEHPNTNDKDFILEE